MQVKGAVAEVAALDANTSIGYTILRKMGWVDGQGLGRTNTGVVIPVAISSGRLIEGVGLGCVNIPDAKLLTNNVEQMIHDFVSDSTRTELTFDADLAKADRALIHVLAQKHNLGHKSQGHGKERFLTVSKRGAARGVEGARIDEAAIEDQFHRAHNSGYNSTMRGAGLGFGSSGRSYTAQPPPKSLLRECMQPAKVVQGLGPPADRSRPPKAQPPPKPQAPPPPAPPPPAQPAAPDAGLAEILAKLNNAHPPPVSQYVSMLHGASSQFSPSDNSARQVLGAPKVFPQSGSNVKAWSAVPRAGQQLEWVRVGFKRPMLPTAVTVYETFNPGSVVCIRGTSQPRGAQAEGSDWFVLWSGAAEWAADGKARKFSPPLDPEHMQKPVIAIEVSMDTREWGEGFWTEIDAIQLDGHPPNAAAGGTAAKDEPAAVETWLERMPWECDAHFNARARFEQAQCGATPPASEEDGLRRSALSMAYQNMTILGCSYPAAVEEAVGEWAVGRRGGGPSGSGFGVEGELRAAAEVRSFS